MKKPVLIYDLCSLPQHIEVERIMKIYDDNNVIFYDSALGEKPQIIDTNNIEVSYLDVSREENLKKLNGYKKRIK